MKIAVKTHPFCNSRLLVDSRVCLQSFHLRNMGRLCFAYLGLRLAMAEKRERRVERSEGRGKNHGPCFPFMCKGDDLRVWVPYMSCMQGC